MAKSAALLEAQASVIKAEGVAELQRLQRLQSELQLQIDKQPIETLLRVLEYRKRMEFMSRSQLRRFLRNPEVAQLEELAAVMRRIEMLQFQIMELEAKLECQIAESELAAEQPKAP